MSNKLKSIKTEYEKLRDIWYKKLKNDGFKDIEREDGSLTVWSTRITNAANSTQSLAKQEYYHMADKFLNEYKFENELEKTIWEYHANALSVRDITKTLMKLNLVKRTNRTTIWLIIKRLEDIMKFMYLPSFRSQ